MNNYGDASELETPTCNVSFPHTHSPYDGDYYLNKFYNLDIHLDRKRACHAPADKRGLLKTFSKKALPLESSVGSCYEIYP